MGGFWLVGVMKRKVAKIGQSTLMVSLPASWVKEHHVKKGDELVVDVKKDGMLSVSKGMESRVKTKASLDLRGMNSSMVWYHLKSLYRRGVDEIEVVLPEQDIPVKNNGAKSPGELVREVVSLLLGMEVVVHTKKKMIIKEVSSVKKDGFELIFKKIFVSVVSMSHEIRDALASGKCSGLGVLITSIDNTINKLCDFCLRILSQYENDMPHKQVYYQSISCLEQIGDGLKDLAARVESVKKREGLKEVSEGLVGLLDASLKAFFSQKESLMSEVGVRRRNLLSLLEKTLRDPGIVVAVHLVTGQVKELLCNHVECIVEVGECESEKGGIDTFI